MYLYYFIFLNCFLNEIGIYLKLAEGFISLQHLGSFLDKFPTYISHKGVCRIGSDILQPFFYTPSLNKLIFY